MAKGYFVVTYRKITNQEKWQAYAKLAVPAIQKSGGRFIVRAMPSAIHEKGMKERVVIVEFDNVHQAMAAHASADYNNPPQALRHCAPPAFRLLQSAA